MKKLSVPATPLAKILLLFTFVGCGSGGEPIDPTAPLVATTVGANSSTSITGLAGSVVAPSPSVVVKDQNGSPIGGAPVTFTIASGGGSVSGATATTDASGIATVGSWTLGPVVGTNILTATSGSLTGVSFTATSAAGGAASLAKNAGDNQTAAAGSTVAIPPAVLVRDANGNPIAGVSVTFAVASGGGSITGATVATNATGIAAVGSWTLGNTAGANSLTATVAGLAAVAFTATSSVGTPASVAKNAGDNQSASAGSPVPVPPSVLVKDANGNPTAGISVTFAVASGGGSVTGATAVTNGTGVATVGAWTLGNATGTNTLTATVGSLPVVTFTATATFNVCAASSTHTFGSTTSGSLASTDCRLSDGSFVDFYTMSVPPAGAYLFRQGAGFDTYLLLAMPDGTTIGENDDEVDTGTNSGIKAILPAGNYLLGPGSFDPGVTGDYQISSTTTSADVVNCESVFVVRSISTLQNIAASDCNFGSSAAPVYSDGYFIFLEAGTTVTINMTSSTLNSYLQLVRLDGINGQIVAENDNVNSGTSDARIVFTATQTNYYAIFARSAAATSSAVGPYTLSIQ